MAMPAGSDPPLPPPAGLPPARHWPRLALLVARATFELGLARIVFARITVPQILARNAATMAAHAPPQPGDTLPAWIRYIMPRISCRMPFRADCLVQALAAQRWLASRHIASAIVIGAERPEHGPFAAHAWLTCASVNVTGGETTRYTELV